jgi:small redox-active disulfide protein 2
MTITVYGVGCAKCRQTEEVLRRVLSETGIPAQLVKVSDIKEMMTAGVMLTPAVAIDGVIKIAGRIPSIEEITGWITTAAS